jgi:hypothetical protein
MTYLVKYGKRQFAKAKLLRIDADPLIQKMGRRRFNAWLRESISALSSHEPLSKRGGAWLLKLNIGGTWMVPSAPSSFRRSVATALAIHKLPIDSKPTSDKMTPEL